MKIKRIFRFIYYLPWTMINRIKYVICGAKVGNGHETYGLIIVKNKGVLKIDHDVRINSTKAGHPMGIGYKTFIKVKKNAICTIGHDTRMSNCSIITAEKIEIGNYVRLGAGSKICDTDFHSLNPIERCGSPERGLVITKPIRIEDYVFVGAEAYILKGVTIGKAAVVGAGAVVTHDIPAYEIWAGNPAKKIGEVQKNI